MDQKVMHIITFSLAIVGALNWGLVGFFNFDLVQTLLGFVPGLAKIAYILVGVSAVYVIATHKNDRKTCAEISKGKGKK